MRQKQLVLSSSLKCLYFGVNLQRWLEPGPLLEADGEIVSLSRSSTYQLQFNKKYLEVEGVNLSWMGGQLSQMSSCISTQKVTGIVPFAIRNRTDLWWRHADIHQDALLTRLSWKKLHRSWILAVKSQWFISSTNPVINYLGLKMYQRRILSWTRTHTLAFSRNLFVIIICLFFHI